MKKADERLEVVVSTKLSRADAAALQRRVRRGQTQSSVVRRIIRAALNGQQPGLLERIGLR